MKKIISIMLTISMLLSMAVIVSADDEITVILDENKLEFDTPPIIENDRVLVPMRTIFEALGVEVEWDGEKQEIKAEKDNTIITLYIGKPEMQWEYLPTRVSGTIDLDVAPKIINDRTLVPLRAVSESFMCAWVYWLEDTTTVSIESDEYDTEHHYVNEYNFFENISDYMPSDENYVISPFSLDCAMGMLYEGAEGETLNEINTFFRNFNDYNTTGRNMVSWHMRRIKEADRGELTIANSIWFNKDQGGSMGDFRETYKNTIKQSYDGETKSVTNQNSVEAVNNWVEKKTNGKITNLLSEENREYLVALVNAIYLKANWKNQFNANDTYEEVFTDINGNETKTDFMHQTDYFSYYEDEDCKAIIMPYENDNMSMVIVLGDTKHILGKLAWYGAQKKKVKLSMPKFKIEYGMSFNDLLKGMGINKAFEDNNPDFDKMVRGIDKTIKIDDVIQKAVIEVDEKGTEAAAATAVTMVTTTALAEPEEIIDFKADEPFTYYIQSTESGALLFAGRYVKSERIGQNIAFNVPGEKDQKLFEAGVSYFK